MTKFFGKYCISVFIFCLQCLHLCIPFTTANKKSSNELRTLLRKDQLQGFVANS